VQRGELAGALRIDGQVVRLHPRDVERLLANYDPSPLRPLDGPQPIALQWFEQPCLIVAFRSPEAYHVNLIDTGGRGWFARYAFPYEMAPPPR
jgi:hypothetical protein